MKHFTFVDPHLDADTAVGGGSLCKAVVDVSTESLKRDSTFVILFTSCDFGTTETT